MKSLKTIKVFVLFALLLGPASLLKSQNPEPDNPAPKPDAQQAPEPAAGQAPAPNIPPATGAPTPITGQARIGISVNQVIVPVTVKDGSGHLVPDLRKDEFRIFEDSIEQRIAYFSNEAFPLSMVVLIDNDLKVKDAEQVAGSLRAIVAGMSATDEAYVCRFDEFFHPGKGFSSDQDKLLTEIKRTELDTKPSVAPPSAPLNNGPVINGHAANSDAPSITGGVMNLKGQSTKALDDAVYSAAEELKDRGRERRKIIFLISDGANGIRANKNSYSATKKELLRYGVSVYSVAVGSAFFERRFNRLVDYAHDTGGDVYFAAKRAAMEELYSRVTEQARNQYTLAYSPAGTNRALDYHSVEVRVKREGLKVDARQGYYAGAAPR
ncbi:MAG: VWA domain-containing protein [Acidobacteriota bacterium]|nr:VWA domain-containing protein [Acidobacteriota bacterium]